MNTLLLVHGAWQGAWAWEPVQERLKTLDTPSLALDLPGSGGDSTPVAEISMEGYARAIIAAARDLDGAVVGVGHSMGGAALTLAAHLEPDLFVRLVYLAAFIPAPGESVRELSSRSHSMGTAGPGAVASGAPPVLTLTPDSIAETFLHDVPATLSGWAGPRFRPQAARPLAQPLPHRSETVPVPASYVHCTQDRAVAPALQRLMAARAGIEDVVQLESGHEPFLSRPGDVARVLSHSGA